jgi:hypothetical protein
MAVLKLDRKAKGSTLIETLVAMTVILISLVFCGFIFLFVLGCGRNFVTLMSHTLMNEISTKTKSERKFVDEKIGDSCMVIQKSVHTYSGIKDLYLQSIIAHDVKGKMLDEYKELIYVPEQ